MSIIFQNVQNHGFWNFDFWFLSRGKKVSVNYCVYECKHIIMKRWKNKSIPHPILCVTSKFFCNITTKLFIAWGNMVNYWAEVCKLLPRDKEMYCRQ